MILCLKYVDGFIVYMYLLYTMANKKGSTAAQIKHLFGKWIKQAIKYRLPRVTD